MQRIPIGENPGGTTIPVLVVPKASTRQVTAAPDGRLRIRVTAQPERGRATQAVAKLLSELLAVPARLLGSGSGRRKRFLVEGLTTTQVQRILHELITLPPQR